MRCINAKKILHIVDNSVLIDSRVIKAAKSGEHHGHTVRVLGRAGTKEEVGEITLDRIEIERITIPTRLKNDISPSSLISQPSRRILAQRNSAKHKDRLQAANRYLRLGSHLGYGLKRSTPTNRYAKAIHLGIGIAWSVISRCLRFYRAMASPINSSSSNNLATPKLAKSERLLQAFLPAIFWRLNDPWIRDFQFAMTARVIQFEPDIIHAHDVRGLAVAVHARDQLKYLGKHPPRVVADVHEWWPGVSWATERVRAAMIAVQDEYLPAADQVITVSDQLAGLINARYGVGSLVVPNYPLIRESKPVDPDKKLRNSLMGLSVNSRVAIYSGALAPNRGLSTAVEALSRSRGWDLVLITNRISPEVQRLTKLANSHHVSHRLHFLPYQSQDKLISFLSDGDIGIIPFHHALNHEISLPTKFGEYLLAGLPILSSDLSPIQTELKRLRVGEVFEAASVDSFVARITELFERCYTERSRIEANRPILEEQYSWDAFEATLITSYFGAVDAPSKARTVAGA